MNQLNHREQRLVALGAAIASNCVPCIEYHIPEARKDGFTDVQIREAVRIADKVRRVPAQAVLQTALAKTQENPDESTETENTGCGCGASTQDSESGCN